MSKVDSEARRAHREFLNRYYGISRHFYDPTRKYYLFGRDRVLDPLAAIDNAQRALAPGGKLLFVDFADLETLPGPAARALRRWLRWFHVEPLETPWLEQTGARLRYGPMRYFVIGELAA